MTMCDNTSPSPCSIFLDKGGIEDPRKSLYFEAFQARTSESAGSAGPDALLTWEALDRGPAGRAPRANGDGDSGVGRMDGSGSSGDVAGGRASSTTHFAATAADAHSSDGSSEEEHAGADALSQGGRSGGSGGGRALLPAVQYGEEEEAAGADAPSLGGRGGSGGGRALLPAVEYGEEEEAAGVVAPRHGGRGGSGGARAPGATPITSRLSKSGRRARQPAPVDRQDEESDTDEQYRGGGGADRRGTGAATAWGGSAHTLRRSAGTAAAHKVRSEFHEEVARSKRTRAAMHEHIASHAATDVSSAAALDTVQLRNLSATLASLRAADVGDGAFATAIAATNAELQAVLSRMQQRRLALAGAATANTVGNSVTGARAAAVAGATTAVMRPSQALTSQSSAAGGSQVPPMGPRPWLPLAGAFQLPAQSSAAGGAQGPQAAPYAVSHPAQLLLPGTLPASQSATESSLSL